MSNLPDPSAQAPMNLQIRYEDLTARYASQVMLNTTAEECFFEFSSGVITDRASGTGVLPIHTRIVMNPNGMLRLYQLIAQALQNYQIVQTNPAPPAETAQPVEAQGGSLPPSPENIL